MKIIMLTAVVLVLQSCFSKAPETTGNEGKQFPDVNLYQLDGISRLSTNQINGPFVLMYYGPDCPYSKGQINEIVENMRDLKNVTFYFITPFSPMKAKSISKEFDLNKFPNIVLACDSNSFVGRYYNVKGFPFTCFFDKNKKLKKAFSGLVTSNEIIKQIGI